MTGVEQRIHNTHIYSGIVAGAENIVFHREKLNEANGFPVPDRDTGNNLAFLMSHIVKNTKPKETIKEMMNHISDEAIISARGNSGAIFSQFFFGFQYACPMESEMSVNRLAECFQDGYRYAYSAIKNPVEGTIVTAIRSFAESFQKACQRGETLKKIYEETYHTLKNTVVETQYTLKEQSEIHAEDAGAKAFLYFVEGFMKMIVDGVSSYKSHIKEDEEEIRNLEEIPHLLHQEIKEQYCTEILIRKRNKMNSEIMKQKLESLGDSLVVSENQNYMRVHIHSNYPHKVVEMFYKEGQILETKAEDMKAQKRLSEKHSGEIALVIDSIADIPQEILPDFVYQLPLQLLADGVSYQDKRTVFSDLFQYAKVTSSQLNQKTSGRFLTPNCEKI